MARVDDVEFAARFAAHPLAGRPAVEVAVGKVERGGECQARREALSNWLQPGNVEIVYNA